MEKHSETEECCDCGILFGVSARYLASLKKTKKVFYCPNGHGQLYTRSEEDELRDELQRERTKRQELQVQLLKATQPRKRGRPKK